MAQKIADTSGKNSDTKPRRNWQRRPTTRRVDLTPEEVAAREELRRQSLRTAHIGIQLTTDERAEIERRAKATGNTLSDFARIVLLSDLKAPAPPARDTEAITALAFQLSKIGTNLNQLAKVANETRALPREADLKAVTDRIVAALDKVYGA